jgi:glycosyltransferase involved in cell wall biosynthesis
MIDLSVIILSHNRPKYLMECINSFISCNFPNKKINISDNSNSTVRSEILDISTKYKIKISFNNTDSLFDHFKYAIKNSTSNYTIIFHDDDRVYMNYKVFVSDLEKIKSNGNFICLNYNGQNYSSNHDNKDNLWISNKDIIKIEKKNLILRYLDNDAGGVSPWSGYIYNTKDFDKNIYDAMTTLNKNDPYFDTYLLIKLLEYGNIYWFNKNAYIVRLHEGSISYKTLTSYKKFINYIKEFHSYIPNKPIVKYRYRNLLVLLIKKKRKYHLQIYFIVYFLLKSVSLIKKMLNNLFFKLTKLKNK